MSVNILKVGLDPILHFEVIARLKSLKGAAKELHLSQPAITQSLSKLEQSLGVPLCVRSRSQFSLTEAGKQLYLTSIEIKKNLGRFQNYIEDDEAFDGVFSVGILDNIQNKVFEDALSKVTYQFPKMKLNIQSFPADEIQDKVTDGELDIGIGLFRGRKNLSYIHVGEEKICHYISEKHPLWKKKSISKKNIKGAYLTWLDIVNRDRTALEVEIFIEENKKPFKVQSYANNLQAAAIILRAGHSIVPFPYGYLETRKLDFKFRKLDSSIEPYTLQQSVVSRQDFTNGSVVTRYFLELLK